MQETPIAVYVGSQAHPSRAAIHLFNLIVPLPSIDKSIVHCVDSTVSAQTLRANGIRVPRVLVIGQRVTTILRSHSLPLA